MWQFKVPDNPDPIEFSDHDEATEYVVNKAYDGIYGTLEYVPEKRPIRMCEACGNYPALDDSFLCSDCEPRNSL